MKKLLLLILLLPLLVVADVKISELPLGTASTSSVQDSFPYVQKSPLVTKRMTLWDIANIPALVSKYAPIANPIFTGTVKTALTSGYAVITGADGSLLTSATTDVEVGYLSGVTSNIQTQINGKEPSITTLPISKGGTNSGAALNSNRMMISSGGAIVESSAITSGRVLISDINGIATHSTVTETTLGYLDATSSIQTQLNGKEPTLAAGTTGQYYRGDKSWQTLDKTAVGLSNVDNTSDATKNSAVADLSNKTFTNKTTFNAEIVGAQADVTTAGAGQTLAAPSTLVVNLTGALTSISGVTAVTGTQPVIYVNKTGSDITVKNQDGTATAANRIITGTAADLTFKSDASIWMVYETTAARWRIVGGSGGSNSVITSSLALGASGTLTLDATSTMQTILVQGNSAPVTLSTTPFGSTAPLNGTIVKLIGNSDTNTVTIPMNDAAKGVLNYSVTLAKGQTVTMEYNSTLDRYVILGVSN